MKYMKSILAGGTLLLSAVSVNAQIQDGIVIPDYIHVFNNTSVTIVVEGKTYKPGEKASVHASGTGRLSIQNEQGKEIGHIEHPVINPNGGMCLERLDHVDYNFSEVLNETVCANLYPNMLVFSIEDSKKAK